MAEKTSLWENAQVTPASYVSPFDGDSSKSKIVRLVEDPEVKKDIKFDEISVNYVGSNANSAQISDQTSPMGSVFPIIRINDIVFTYDNIVKMEIESSEFIPTISLVLAFPSQRFADKDMPKDGDIISTFIRSNTNTLNYLRNDFIITSCDSNMRESSMNRIFLDGKMLIDGFESHLNVVSMFGSSKDVCKNIAKKFNIGFSYNDEDDTDDYQMWICSGSAEDFVKHVISHAWKDNKSFFNAWIDLYYDLCFVNVNKFLLSEGEQEDVDVTFSSAVDIYQIAAEGAVGETTEDTKFAMKLFSNMQSFRGTPFFIKSWKIGNESGNTVLEKGYIEMTYSFIHNQNLYETDPELCFSILSNVPAYDKDKLDSYMILRGRTTYNESTGETMERVNRDMANLYVSKHFAGIEYVIDDDTNSHSKDNNKWTGNINKNYGRAVHHNDINLEELNKMYIDIETDGLCLQVMRGEKIPVVLEKGAASFTKLNEEERGTVKAFNRMYSGFYIVDSISYVYNGNGSQNGRSPFSTKMRLKRREWPTPEDIKVDKNNEE